MKKPSKAEDISLLKGLLAGLAGGLAGSAAKVVAEELFPPLTKGHTIPPRILVDRALEATNTSVPEPAKQAATQGIHWAFGTMIGGAYGVAAELSPKVTAWRGGVFGLTVNRVAHDNLLPRMELVEPVPEQSAQQRISERVSHVVYGVTTDVVRRMVRKRL